MQEVSKSVISTTITLVRVQHGLKADDEVVRNAAESVLSALVLHLRKPKARLPADLEKSLATLELYYDGKWQSETDFKQEAKK